jgi:hypothetical protein
MKRVVKAHKWEGESSRSNTTMTIIVAEGLGVPDEFEISWDESEEHHCDEMPGWAKIKSKTVDWWFDIWVWDGAREVQINYCPFCGVKL